MATSSPLFVLLAPCLLLLLSTQSASAAVSFGWANPDPAHPDNCLLGESGPSIPVGEWGLVQGKCEKYYCEKWDRKLTFTIHTCPSLAPPRGCVIKEDLSLPYPNCCYGMVCS